MKYFIAHGKIEFANYKPERGCVRGKGAPAAAATNVATRSEGGFWVNNWLIMHRNHEPL